MIGLINIFNAAIIVNNINKKNAKVIIETNPYNLYLMMRNTENKAYKIERTIKYLLTLEKLVVS